MAGTRACSDDFHFFRKSTACPAGRAPARRLRTGGSAAPVRPLLSPVDRKVRQVVEGGDGHQEEDDENGNQKEIGKGARPRGAKIS